MPKQISESSTEKCIEAQLTYWFRLFQSLITACWSHYSTWNERNMFFSSILAFWIEIPISIVGDKLSWFECLAKKKAPTQESQIQRHGQLELMKWSNFHYYFFSQLNIAVTLVVSPFAVTPHTHSMYSNWNGSNNGL